MGGYIIRTLRDNIDLDRKEIGDITPMFKSKIYRKKKNSVRMAYILYTFQDEDFQLNSKRKWFLK